MSETKPVLRRQLQPAIPIDTASIVRWEDRQGNEVALNVPLVRELFKQKHALTDAEILMFLHQARSRRANPFLGDIYAIKYAADSPLAIQAGYHFFMRVAKENPAYDGFEVWCVDSNGKRIPDGLETEANSIAAICEVYLKNQSHAVKFVAPMKDFNKRQALWVTMAVPMLKKCAVGNAHRQAEPSLANMYLPEEVEQVYVKMEPIASPPSQEPQTLQEPAPVLADVKAEESLPEVPTDAGDEQGPPSEPSAEAPALLERQNDSSAPIGVRPEESNQACPRCGEAGQEREGKQGPYLACAKCGKTWRPKAEVPGQEKPAEIPVGPDARQNEEIVGLVDCFAEEEVSLKVPDDLKSLPRAEVDKWLWKQQKKLAALRAAK